MSLDLLRSRWSRLARIEYADGDGFGENVVRPTGRWYHASPVPLPLGTVLVPGGEGGRGGRDFPIYNSEPWRTERLWISPTPEAAKARAYLHRPGYVYGVRPDGPVFPAGDMSGEFACDRATVVSLVSQPHNVLVAQREAKPVVAAGEVSYTEYPYSDGVIIEAHVGGKQVGSIDAGEFLGDVIDSPFRSDLVWEIRNIEVERFYRGRGIATELFRRAQEEAKRRGEVLVHSPDRSLDADQWLERLKRNGPQYVLVEEDEGEFIVHEASGA